MTVAAISTAVQERIGADRLIQLTNYDTTATSINTTVLNAACQDAIGEFERITGMAHDSSNASHVVILVLGAQYFLEMYKGRDNAIMANHQRNFYTACQKFRDLLLVTPASSSVLEASRDSAGSRPDMDRAKNLWRAGGTISLPQETDDFEGDM